jgi:hypothetical protein
MKKIVALLVSLAFALPMAAQAGFSHAVVKSGESMSAPSEGFMQVKGKKKHNKKKHSKKAAKVAG